MNDLILSPTCQIPTLKEIYQTYFPNKTDGLFVEVGAFDGDSYSNTSGLADLGWRGVYIGPIREYAEKCTARHAKNNVTTYTYAISNEHKVIEMSKGEALSSASTGTIEAYKNIPWAQSINFESTQVQAVRLESILMKENLPPHFDLLVVDVEGFEEIVFESFTFNQYKPKMIIVELIDLNPHFDSTPILKNSARSVREKIQSAGYRTVYADHINTIFLAHI